MVRHGPSLPDLRLAENPALAEIAQINPARANEMLRFIDKRLAKPLAPSPRSGVALERGDGTILDTNPLLNQLYTRDPDAALDLLTRIKSAGKPK